MKTATIFVLAVTAFAGLLQQTSAAPQSVDSHGNRHGGHCCVGEDSINDFNSLATENIESSDAALADVVKALKDALAAATNDAALNAAVEYLSEFQVLVAELHSGLRNAGKTGDIKDLKDIEASITKAIGDTEAAVDELSPNLDGSVKDTFVEKLGTIVNNAKEVVAKIGEIVP